LPTEIQLLGSQPAGKNSLICSLLVNFSLCEVYTGAYGEQQNCLLLSVIDDIDHGIQQPDLNEKAERIKSSNITTSLTL
jgi:hypothetical protein